MLKNNLLFSSKSQHRSITTCHIFAQLCLNTPANVFTNSSGGPAAVKMNVVPNVNGPNLQSEILEMSIDIYKATVVECVHNSFSLMAKCSHFMNGVQRKPNKCQSKQTFSQSGAKFFARSHRHQLLVHFFICP